MPVPRAVIDTNVLVSGLLTSLPEAPTVQVLDGMLQGRFLFLFSDELLSEYREVVLRPSLRRLHRLGEEDVDVILRSSRSTAPIESRGRPRRRRPIRAISTCGTSSPASPERFL